VVHTSEGAQTFRSLGNWLANPANQVSYQVGFDDTTSTEIGEYVAHNLTAWAAMSANSWGEHGCCCTPSGASSGWSRADWLAHDNMLRACGAWLGEEAARYRVPLVKIGASEITAGRSGICGHGDCSAAGSGGSHTDPGPHFPWDVVIVYAIDGRPFPAPKGDDMPKARLMQAPDQPVYLVSIDLQSRIAIRTPERLNDVLWMSHTQDPPLLVSEEVTPTSAQFLAMIPDVSPPP
jgi:hypothetical protein